MSLLPDFIIAGAPKCGTTALWNFLNELPEVCMAAMKEPKFFTELKGSMETQIKGDGPRTSGNYEKGIEWYSSLFENCKKDQILGEASTLYFCNYDAAEKIHRYVPNVKLIFMLRNPAQRIYSHYRQEYKLGFNFPDFEEMISQNHPRFRFYLDISKYKKHLERFYSLFSESQILILLMDDFRLDPEKEYKKVTDFLGLSFTVNKVPDLRKEYNQQIEPKNRFIARWLTIAQQSKISKLIPQDIRKRLYKIRSNLVALNSTQVIKNKLDDRISFTLLQLLEDDISYVRNLLNRKELWRK